MRLVLVDNKVLPAHVGMVPVLSLRLSLKRSSPRSRGDGPNAPITFIGGGGFSPLTWGWSLHGVCSLKIGRVLPAHVGMVPESLFNLRFPKCSPRSRGDGPGEVISSSP